MRRVVGAAAGLGLSLTPVVLPVSPAVAAPAFAAPAFAAPDNCAQGKPLSAPVSWARQMLAVDATTRLDRGGGLIVAVLSTGVRKEPQIGNRLLPGFDAVAGKGAVTGDCTGTGTQVTGVIAAQPVNDSPVLGLSYRVRVLPVRVVPDEGSRDQAAQPGPLAKGITFAVQNDADVIVVTNPVYQDGTAAKAAVADAISKGIPVIAAAGDLGAGKDGNPTPYPAAYPDVIGVGAIDPAGQIAPSSAHGEFVDLVAPGVAVPTLQGGSGGLIEADGTAVAAGYVGAAAALVKSRRSGDTTPAQLAKALTVSASPTVRNDAFGAGVVNPYAAITAQAAQAGARPLPELSPATQKRSDAENQRRQVAFVGATIAAVAVLLVLLVTAAIRRSRRQHWRPGLAAPLPVVDEPIEPGPPVMLLADQTESGNR
jgi:membrane-anchored mycosin MYCP